MSLVMAILVPILYTLCFATLSQTKHAKTSFDQDQPNANQPEGVNGLRIKSFIDIEGKKHFHAKLQRKKPQEDKQQRTLSNDDIILSSHVLHHHSTIDVERRKLVPSDRYLWPNSIIVYRFNNTKRKFKQKKSKMMVRQAMDIWEKHTCVKFVEFSQRLQYGIEHEHYIDIGTGNGCASVIGFIASGAQVMRLNEYHCMRIGIILHELGHTMGLFHEQARVDRSRWIKVILKHVKKNHRHNFNLKRTRLVAPYDLGSIMHYGTQFFTTARKYDTITVKDHRLRFLIGQRYVPSFYDYYTINRGYKCNRHCDYTADICENDGYRAYDCICICPDGLKGARCNEVISTSCGGVISLDETNSRAIITSPDYPNSGPNVRCVWLFKAPKSGHISTVLEHLDVARHVSTHMCLHWVEVRYYMIGQLGPSYCGVSDVPIKFKSLSDFLLISYDSSKSPVTPRKGFKMLVDFTQTEAKNLCKNGGTIVQNSLPLQCSCSFGFSGQFCEMIVKGMSCDFDDESLCFIHQDSHDQFQWSLNKGPTKSKKTGPKADVSKSGYYIYAEASKPHTPGDVARLFIYNLTGGEWCFLVYYNMYGVDMGRLRIWLTLSSGHHPSSPYVIRGNQGIKWKPLYLDFFSKRPFTIVIEGVRGRSWDSDMALDQLSITPTKCKHSEATLVIPHTPDDYRFSCNFERDLCNLVQQTNDIFDWLRVTKRGGEPPSTFTGPKSGFGGGGFFIYMEASKPRIEGDTAIISSPTFNFISSSACISFSIYAYGVGLGHVIVKVSYSTQSAFVIWGADGPVREDIGWISVSLNVPVSTAFKVVFEGMTGHNFRGDYALDNIEVHNGNCSGEHIYERIPYLCTFEEGTCLFTNQKLEGETEGWVMSTHNKPDSILTHVMSATFGNVQDSGNTRGSAKLISGAFVFAGRYCLKFDYSLDTELSNNLRVIVFTEGSDEGEEIWSIDGAALWKHTSVSFSAIGSARITFLCNVYWGYAHYVLDNIRIDIGHCV